MSRRLSSSIIATRLIFFTLGRALEIFLTVVPTIWGIVLIKDGGLYKSVILYDVSEELVGGVLLFFASISSIGLILNFYGSRCDRFFRVTSAIGFMTIWSWVVIKAVLLEAQDILAFAFALSSVMAYVWLLVVAFLDLPKPGTPAYGFVFKHQL